ncbi:MAG: secretion system protein [Anaerolineae bacterium]|nr:MAG: secretion system protein [Anaerolineae bacterium]
MFNIILIGGGILVLILLIVGVVVSATSERALVEERLKQYLDEESDEALARARAESTALTEWMERRVSRSSFGERIARELARADLKLKVSEYIALIVITTIVGAVLAAFLGGWDIISAAIGGVAGFFLPRLYVKRQQRQRLIRFNDQLPDMLNLMVNGVRAGYSTMQAIEAASREMPSPMSEELHRVVQEMQLGIPMERALDNLLRRIPSDDLDFVITAINVQREVGGNLAEILDTIAYTIRERVRIKGEIRVLTAQVRTSGTILSLIPVFLTLILWFLNRQYLMTFFERSVLCGAIALGIAVILIISGYYAMMRIADIEV